MKGDVCLGRVLWRREGNKMDENTGGLCFVMKVSWVENVRKRKRSWRDSQRS